MFREVQLRRKFPESTLRKQQFVRPRLHQSFQLTGEGSELLFAVAQGCLGAPTLDPLGDGVGDGREFIEGGVGKGAAGEQRHHAEHAAFEQHRIAGERDHAFSFGP